MIPIQEDLPAATKFYILSIQKDELLKRIQSKYVYQAQKLVGSVGCTRIGLTSEEIEQAENTFRAVHNKKKSIPDSAYLIKQRNPILIMHVIQTKLDPSSSNTDVPGFLFALGVGLPKTEHETETATYVVNLVELKNWLPDEEEYE